MPVYEYKCQNETCGEFEAQQKMTEPHLEKCPRCGAEKPTRLISKSSFHLASGGVGWSQNKYSAR